MVIAFAIAFIYLLGAVGTLVLLARDEARDRIRKVEPHCHEEHQPQFRGLVLTKWHQSKYCLRYDEPGCWRTDPILNTVVGKDVKNSAFKAVIWPVYLALSAALRVANIKPPLPAPPANMNLDAEIEKAEAELEKAGLEMKKALEA